VIRGIKFVGIPVRDQDKALKFYTETLGFKVMTDQPFTPTQRWIELLIPGAETGLSLFTPEGHEDRIGEFHSISFWCDDVCQGTYERSVGVCCHLSGSRRQPVRSLQQR